MKNNVQTDTHIYTGKRSDQVKSVEGPVRPLLACDTTTCTAPGLFDLPGRQRGDSVSWAVQELCTIFMSLDFAKRHMVVTALLMSQYRKGLAIRLGGDTMM